MNRDKKIVFIFDECHRSQFGETHGRIVKYFNNHQMFGFTGTPKEKTLELFGTRQTNGEFIPFHVYSMYQSIHEGFTLDVLQNYTTYKRFFKLKPTDRFAVSQLDCVKYP